MQITFSSDDDLALVQSILDLIKVNKNKSIPMDDLPDINIEAAEEDPDSIYAPAPKTRKKKDVPVIIPKPQVIQEVIETPMPPPPPPPPIPVPQMAQVSEKKDPFISMMLYVADLLTAGLITHEKIEEFCRMIDCVEKEKGVVAKLRELPNLIPTFLNLVEDHVNKTQA